MLLVSTLITVCDDDLRGMALRVRRSRNGTNRGGMLTLHAEYHDIPPVGREYVGS